MNEGILFLLKIGYFVLPCALANMAPVFAKNVFSNLAFPLDGGKTIGGNPILGKNKTFRGLIFGIIGGIIVVYLQSLLQSITFFGSISILDYSQINVLLLGFLMGLGTIFGDSVKSFIKRRVNVKPGESFMPWDQIDAPLGMIFFTSFVINFDFYFMLGIISIFFFGHLLVRTIGYYTGINKERW